MILDKLRQTGFHPTAVEIYNEVLKHIPNISLGTVYRNLDIMSKTGIIRKIETCGDQKRYDAVTKDHLHIICTCCGRIQDLEEDLDINMNKLANIETEFKITGVRFEIMGFCPECDAERDTF